jgi:hypothetical protein
MILATERLLEEAFFATELQVGDVVAYTPLGLGFPTVGTVASIVDDAHLTLAANATPAPAVTSLATAVKYGAVRTARSYTHMLPEDANDEFVQKFGGSMLVSD